MSAPMSPRVPAQVEPYVRVLGVDGTVEFLLAFGGAELYLTETPGKRSRLVGLIGQDKAAALARASERLPRRIPLAKPWVAAVLKEKGLSTSDIARRLHASDVAVRGWLRKFKAPAAPDPDQPELPL